MCPGAPAFNWILIREDKVTFMRALCSRLGGLPGAGVGPDVLILRMLAFRGSFRKTRRAFSFPEALGPRVGEACPERSGGGIRAVEYRLGAPGRSRYPFENFPVGYYGIVDPSGLQLRLGEKKN